MSRYEALLFLHVGAAAIWIGGVAMHLALMGLARRFDTQAQALTLLRYDELLATRLYIPASLVVLGAGIGLVLEGGWEWGQLWIVLGLVIFATAFMFGAAVSVALGKRLHVALAAHGPESRQVESAIRQLRAGARIDLLILLAALLVMTTKPGL